MAKVEKSAIKVVPYIVCHLIPEDVPYFHASNPLAATMENGLTV